MRKMEINKFIQKRKQKLPSTPSSNESFPLTMSKLNIHDPKLFVQFSKTLCVFFYMYIIFFLNFFGEFFVIFKVKRHEFNYYKKTHFSQKSIFFRLQYDHFFDRASFTLYFFFIATDPSEHVISLFYFNFV
jgi:hypothetical protein